MKKLDQKNKSGFARSAGILLPVSSLPSPYGIGSFGKAAFRWVDFLRDSGQSFWQILPLSPLGYGDSPYSSFSAFAGNPYFIDLDILYYEGLLSRKDFANIKWGNSSKRVDYEAVYANRENVLRKAFAKFKDDAALDDFAKQNPWVGDFGLYMSVKASQGGRPWTEWDEPLRLGQLEAVSWIREGLAEDIRYHIFAQYQFMKQWQVLHEYANAKGVQIIGDIPFYVSMDSVDVWSDKGSFLIDRNGLPTEVAGCPPDNFSEDGQLWGNPLYDWDAMGQTGYKWWIRRLKSSFELCDALRIDHFRGLESYFAIPYGEPTAKDGVWKPGPGKDFISALKRALPGRHIIAEDLGFLTDEVRQLLEFSGYPGMKLLQFAFDSRVSEDYRPFTYSANTVVYPGTHDNDTLSGWCKTAPRESIQKAMDYIGIKSRGGLPRSMIRLTMQAVSDLSIIPMQDWLELGSEARMNTPSTLGGNNWRWRLEAKALNSRLSDSIAEMTALYGRVPSKANAKNNNINNSNIDETM